MALSRTLTTDRLRLESTYPEHSEALWKAIETSLDELRVWMPWAADTSLEATLTYASLVHRRWAAGLEWSFTMFEDESAVGAISLMRYAPERKTAEMGYWIRSDRAGQGLVTEAGAALCRFGFDELHLNRIEIMVAVDNHPSIKVAMKLGFTREGVMRQASLGGDRTWQDLYLYSLLASDPGPGF